MEIDRGKSSVVEQIASERGISMAEAEKIFNQNLEYRDKSAPTEGMIDNDRQDYHQDRQKPDT